MTADRVVSALTHPLLFGAMIELLYDNGGVNRSAPEPTEIAVPFPFLHIVDAAESELRVADLDGEELQTLVAGEMAELEALVADRGLHNANIILEGFFNDWNDPVCDAGGEEAAA